jgi:hypothetical protein
MTTTDKRSLISESIAAIQIDIHLVGEEPDWHIIRMAPGVSRTTTVGEVYTKSKSGLCSRDEVLAPSDARLGHYLGLPHSPSNKPPQCREGQFDKVVPGLLGLPCPIKPDMRPAQIKACHRNQSDTVLNWHRRGLPPWNSHDPLLILPFWVNPFPLIAPPGHILNTWTWTSTQHIFINSSSSWKEGDPTCEWDLPLVFYRWLSTKHSISSW